MSVQMSQIGAWFDKVGVVRQYSRPGVVQKKERTTREAFLPARASEQGNVIGSVRLLASERSERDTLRSVQLRIADIYIYYILEKWFPLWGEQAHS